MAPRASWKGFLNLSLVSVSVKAYTATSDSTSISLNQLHSECHSRIRYEKKCPIHGVVGNDEIVKGYEYAKDQYVIIDLDELEQLRTKTEQRSIRIDQFVPLDSIDPILLSSSNYYLVPDGPAGQKPYALIQQAMLQRQVACVAQVVISKREQLVLIRPLEKLLCMTILRYASDVKLPESFHDQLVDVGVTDAELSLASTLIDETTEEQLDLSRYHDDYSEKLRQLIDAKVSGKELVAAPSAEPTHVINLMDALKASVDQARVTNAEEPPAKAAPKVARKKKKPAASSTKKAADALKDQLARKSPTKKKSTRKKKTG